MDTAQGKRSFSCASCRHQPRAGRSIGAVAPSPPGWTHDDATAVDHGQRQRAQRRLQQRKGMALLGAAASVALSCTHWPQRYTSACMDTRRRR